MISSAFKSAYTSEVSARNQTINTITTGVKDAAVAVAGLMGFGGLLGDGAFAEASKHALANKVGGIGGNIMLMNTKDRRNAKKAAESLPKGRNEAQDFYAGMKALTVADTLGDRYRQDKEIDV